jgi:predicted metalloprotease with PDZ domain
VSYYTKGNILAAALDLTIIHHSRAKYQLDDVLQAMYDEYFLRKDVPFQEADLQQALEKAAGISLDEFFRQYVHGTEPLPWPTLLGYAGLEIVDAKAGQQVARLGIVPGEDDGKVIIRQVDRNTAAWTSGLNVDDEVIAVNGTRVTGENWSMLEASASPGDVWQVLISRDGLLRAITCTLQSDNRVQYRIRKMENPSKRQQDVYMKWLGFPFNN